MVKETIKKLEEMLNKVTDQHGSIEIINEISGFEVYYQTKEGYIISIGIGETLKDAIMELIKNVIFIFSK